MSAVTTHASFPETRWTLIAQLSAPETQEFALEALCQRYWSPVYAFLRRHTSAHDAEDMTQDFLVMVIDRHLFERAAQGNGRLRSWLLGSLDLFVRNERRTANSQKRGGGMMLFSLDNDAARQQIGRLAADCMTPAEAFDRAWVDLLIRQSVATLASQYHAAGRTVIFEALEPWLLREGEAGSQEESADRCGLTLTNFRVQLHRLRGRYRDELRRQIALTVEKEEDVQSELHHLFSVFGRQL